MYRLFQITALLILSIHTLNAQQACGCDMCAFPVANGTEQTLFIQISGAQNSDLSALNQGLCNVSLDFSHNMVNEIDIALHSPTGQSIQLVPSAVDSNLTPLGRWIVDFVPCDSLAIPDTPYVSNFGQNIWQPFQTQRGSYYPADGCLEDFNIGTVNGTWRLVLRESATSIWAAVVTQAHLEFCDMTGVTCSVGVPEPSPASACSNAEFVVELNNHFGSNYGATTSDSTTGFCGIADNEQWIAFVAPDTAMQISVVAGNCTLGNGLQTAIYAACDAPPLLCDPGSANGISTPNILNINALNIGTTYFLMVDGFAGDACDFFIQSSVNTGSVLGNPSIPMGNSSVCVPSTQRYTTQEAFNTNGYKWSILGDGIFPINGQKTLLQIGSTPTPIDVDWDLNAGSICVQSFANGDTSQALCRGVLADTIVRIQLPFQKLCAADVPYQPPFPHPTVSSSGTYSFLVENTGACDTLFEQIVEVSTVPAVIDYPSIILSNGQCFTLPDGNQVCDAGTYAIEIQQADGCATLHRFSINTIEYAPITLACAPLIVPFSTAGPDTASFQWDFAGGMMVDTGGLIQAVYENEGLFGFQITVNGSAYAYEAQFGVQTKPQAEIALQLQDSLLTAANSGTGNPTTWEWTFGDGNVGAGNPVMHTYMDDGLYQVTLIVENPCGIDMDSTTILYSTVANKVASEQLDFSIFPNPADTHFYIKTNGTKGLLKILDAQGKTYITKVIQSPTFVPQLIKTNTLPYGTYWVQWQDAQGRISTKKLIIQ